MFVNLSFLLFLFTHSESKYNRTGASGCFAAHSPLGSVSPEILAAGAA